MRQLFEVADFVRAARRELRFGEVSRAPLRLLRFTIEGGRAECDWLTRAADPWTAGIPDSAWRDCACREVLVDAMALRDLVLRELDAVQTASLRGFRARDDGGAELIVAGTIRRDDDPYLLRVPSPAMRAKLCGFEFHIENGSFQTLAPASGELVAKTANA
jgi:hypothetical protein